MLWKVRKSVTEPSLHDGPASASYRNLFSKPTLTISQTVLTSWHMMDMSRQDSVSNNRDTCELVTTNFSSIPCEAGVCAGPDAANRVQV